MDVKRSSVALILGIICHTSFLAAVAIMMYDFFWGITRTPCPLPLPALPWDLLLLIQFPLFHSLLLTRWGRNVLSKIAPGSLGKDLVTTTFTAIASLQVVIVFFFWQPIDRNPFVLPTPFFALATTLYVISWLLLARSMFDAGLGVQSGSLGWLSVLRGKRPKYDGLRTGGLYKFIRHPIYASFFLIMVTGPVWSTDRIIFVGIWGSYCVIGPIFKERRFSTFFGEQFRQYRKRVPYMIPKRRV